MAQALEVRRQKARSARREMRQAKETLATVVDTSQVAFVCADLDQSIALWSRGAEQMFGYGADEMLGRAGGLVPPEAEAEAQALFRRVRSGETVRDLHVKRPAQDGTLLDVRLAAAPMHNPDGTVRNIAFAYEDITGRKAAEEQLRKLAHYDQLTGPAQPRLAATGIGAAAGERRRQGPALHRAVRSRRVQGRQRYARPFDRRPAAG